MYSKQVLSIAILVALGLPQTTSAEKTKAPQITLSAELQKQCLKVLRGGMQGEEFWPAIHAAEGLTLAGRGDEVRKFLEPKLATEKDDQRRCGIVRELVRAGDCEKGPIMLDILAKEDPHGHIHACESSYKVGQVGDGKLMRQAAQRDNLTLQLMASAALGRNGDEASMKRIRQLLRHKDATISRVAAWILGRIGNKSDIIQLYRNTVAAPDELTRCYNEHALAALGDKAGQKALLRNLKSKDAAVRTYAATFAGDARTVAAKELLVELLEDENVDVRVRAAQTLMVLHKQPLKHACGGENGYID